MFYNKNDLKSIFSCKKCDERLDQARALPCGSNICNFCAKSLQIENNKYECIVCNQSHLIINNELPLNKEITETLKLQPVEVSRGRSHDKLEKTLQTMNTIYNQIKLGVTNGVDYIEEYCMNLKNELQLVKEEHIQALEEYSQTLLDEIDKFRKDRVLKVDSNLDLINDFNELLEELKLLNDKSSSYLKNNKINDDLVDKMNEDGEKLIEKAKRKNTILDSILFDKVKPVLIRGTKLEFEDIFGTLEFKSTLSSFLNLKQFEELIGLCKFDSNIKWKQIYRASQDGFSAKEFHSKCDNQKNTLIVIKSTNGNIFGGYTEKDWSGINVYKDDPNAFLFSLKNNHNKPMLFHSSISNFSIYCSNKFGPTFGSGHDLFICDNSNTVNSSYSKLGSSYLFLCDSNPLLFLASSSNFSTTEIEVFTKAN